jgi:hypothetical protein
MLLYLHGQSDGIRKIEIGNSDQPEQTQSMPMNPDIRWKQLHRSSFLAFGGGRITALAGILPRHIS